MDVYGTKRQIPSGVDAFEDALAQYRISLMSPSNGTIVTNINYPQSQSGTISHPPLATTNFKTRASRWTLTSAATAGTVIFHRPSLLGFSRDIGFNCVALGGITTLVAGQRWFMGIVDSGVNPTNVDPLTATTPGRIGLAFNTNSGNLSLVRTITGAAPTVTDLGASFPVNITDVWKLELSCSPAQASIDYRITNLSTAAVLTGNLSTNIPAAATLLGKQVWTTNNATALACAIDLMRLYSRSNN